MSNKKQRNQNRANYRELAEYLQTIAFARVQEEDRRMGQPNYGHEDERQQDTTVE